MPLAILIFVALAAGVTLAITRPGDLAEEDGGTAQPQPTAATVQPSPSPTATLVSPSPEITEEPTVEPTEEPTEEPTTEPTEEPDGNGNGGNGNGGNGNGGNGNGGNEEPTLADTGGPVLPWFLGGALMMAGGAGLWRIRRRPY